MATWSIRSSTWSNPWFRWPDSSGTDPTNARSHNVVHERRNRHGVQYSAVFPHVLAGTYTVWPDATTPGGQVTIHGGHVTDFDLT